MSTVNATSYRDASGGGNAVLFGVAAPANSMGFRNRIINGDMRIDQRNNGGPLTVNSDANFYAVDRTRFSGVASSGVFTGQRVLDAPAGFINSLKATVTTTDTSLAGSDLYYASQSIEGSNIADLAWGSASAVAVTLSFWVKASVTGTFGGALSNNSVTRSYPFTYSISAANTWEYKTVTIAGDTTGVWTTDSTTSGIRVYFGLGIASGFAGTAGAWAGFQFLSATGAVNLMATSGATWQITGVQLEAGSVASPFERRDVGREIIMCQRYYEIGRDWQIFSGYVVTSDIYYNPVRFIVEKRAAPLVTPAYIAASRFAAAAPAVPLVRTDGFYAQATATLTGTGYYQYTWTAASEL
jgi:hypothetical protein